MSSSAQRNAKLGDPLTERELDILALVAEGRTNKQIGAELFIPMDTVRWWCVRMYIKLGARDRAHAVHLGHKVGYLRGDL